MVALDVSDRKVEPILTVLRSVSTGEDSIDIALESGGRDLIDRHAQAWRTLCDRAQPEMAFLRPEMVSAYFQVFGGGDRVVLMTARRDGELVALLPLHEKSLGAGPLRITWLRSAGNVHFHRFDALYAHGEDPDLIAARFWMALHEEYPRSAWQFERALTGGVVERMLGLASRGGHLTETYDPDETPYVAVPPKEISLEEIIALQGKSLRGSLRRGLRRLGERGTLRFVHVDGEAEGKDMSKWLERFCDLEHRGWKGAFGTSINSNRATSSFYRTIMLDEGLRPYARCLALMLDDEMIAGDIGFIANGIYFGMKLAVDDDARDCSPGHLMMLFELADFAARGIREIDLGGKAESYKLFWTSTSRPYSHMYIFPKGIRGSVIHAIVFDGAFRARDYLRTKPVVETIRRTLRKLPFV